MSNQFYPRRGNLAWAAIPSLDDVEVWDRFNGVPSLGIMRAGSQSTLFWRAVGYLSDVSAWIYVPLEQDEAIKLSKSDKEEPLAELLFHSPVEREGCCGIAVGNRLRFEREWMVPPSRSSVEIINDALTHMVEALEIAEENQLPATRSEMRRLHDAVKHMVPC